MSLIINGMSLPSECSECLFSCYDVSVGAPAECIILGERSARYSRLKKCPLTEIPTPHGRLIDADELTRRIERAYGDKDIVKLVTNNIARQQTIVEAEVSE